jgi:hypothetical protein
VVILIRSATTAEGRDHERRLFDELNVTLDGFMLLSQNAERPDFPKLSLSEQIASVVPDAVHNGAMIVLWMSSPLPHQVMLHLVAIGSGRAFVRTIETQSSSGSEATLALIARELLGTAYLFAPAADVPAEVSEVVRAVKRQIPPEPAPVESRPPTPPGWNLWVRTQAGYPLLGGEDAVPALHLGVSLERRLWRGVLGSLELGGRYSAVSRAEASGARLFSAGLTGALFLPVSARSVSWGPYAAASLGYSRFLVEGQSGGAVIPRFEAGAQVRSGHTSGPGVGLALTAAFSPVRAELRSADARVLFRTPSLELLFGFAGGWAGL